MRHRGKSQSKRQLALFGTPKRHRRAAISANAPRIAKAISEPQSGLTAAKLACRRNAAGRDQRAAPQIDPAAQQPARHLPPHPERPALPRRGRRGRRCGKPVSRAARHGRSRRNACRRREKPRQQRRAKAVTIGASRTACPDRIGGRQCNIADCATARRANRGPQPHPRRSWCSRPSGRCCALERPAGRGKGDRCRPWRRYSYGLRRHIRVPVRRDAQHRPAAHAQQQKAQRPRIATNRKTPRAQRAATGATASSVAMSLSGCSVLSQTTSPDRNIRQ